MKPTLPLLLLLAAAPVQATELARLRPEVTLDAGVVRLSDLFDAAGPQADRVLGPAPAPGGRIIVEAPQLAAIASEFNVAWRPGSPADRAVLDRPGRPVPRGEAMAALRSALASAGAPEHCGIELPGFDPPLVPFGEALHPVVSNLDYDRASGRFSALLSITAHAMDPVNIRVAGRVIEMVDVIVPVRTLPPGTVLQADDLRSASVRASLLQSPVARVASDAAGMAVAHLAPEGQPLALAELHRPNAVTREQAVLLLLDSPGMTLSAQGRALQSGAVGDRIRVVNTGSRAIVLGVVVGDGQVRVMPGSAPYAPAQVAAQVAAR